MPNFDFDFEDVYGKSFEKMTRNERDSAVMSQLYYLRRDLKLLNGKTKSIPWLEKMGWAGAVTIPAIIGWLIYLTKCFFGMK